MSEPRTQDEIKTTMILSGLTAFFAGLTIIAAEIFPLEAIIAPASITFIFAVFFVWSACRLPM